MRKRRSGNPTVNRKRNLGINPVRLKNLLRHQLSECSAHVCMSTSLCPFPSSACGTICYSNNMEEFMLPSAGEMQQLQIGRCNPVFTVLIQFFSWLRTDHIKSSYFTPLVPLLCTDFV